MANARIGSHPSHGYQMVETIDTTAKQLEWKDSGKIFMCVQNGTADVEIFLPKLTTEIAGWHAKFIAAAANGAHTITITAGGASTAFAGVTLQAGDTVEHTGTASAVIAASDFKLGDFFEVMFDGTKFHITGMFDTASSLAVS